MVGLLYIKPNGIARKLKTKFVLGEYFLTHLFHPDGVGILGLKSSCWADHKRQRFEDGRQNVVKGVGSRSDAEAAYRV